MPLYYFDIAGPNGAKRDDTGGHHADLTAVCRHASGEVCRAASDYEGDERGFAYTVRVRDQTGAMIYRATLTMTQTPR